MKWQFPTREERITIAEATLAQLTANGWKFLPGTRNRLLFTVQAKMYHSMHELYNEIRDVLSRNGSFQ